MTHKKVWALHKPDATQVDATYIIGLGCEVEVILPDPIDFTSVNGTRWTVQNERPYINITTTCEKQESQSFLRVKMIFNLLKL